MALTYRVPQLDECESFMRPVWRGFGDPGPEEGTLEDEKLLWEPERSIGALDGDEWVGGTGAFTLDLTLPGGARIPAAGVTMVGVASTHRRRGIARELMRRQLDDVAALGETVAILTASEGSIYGRFGYGPATSGIRLRVATQRSAFRSEVLDGPDPGRLRALTLAEAEKAVPDLFDRVGRVRPGSISRSAPMWTTHWWNDRAIHRGGASAQFTVIHEAPDGTPDGYAFYRIRPRRDGPLPASEVRVEELVAASDDVEARLWRFCLDIDLMAELTALHLPVDTLLRWQVRDPRQVRVEGIDDFLWARVLDVAGFLGARRYGTAGSLVLDVLDEFRPASAARVRIEVDVDGSAEVGSTDAEPDLVLGAESLGALCLGGVAPSVLGRVRRIEEGRAGALSRADALFAAECAPYCCTMF